MTNASFGNGVYHGGGVSPGYLAGLTYAGRTGWRYPTVGELAAALNSSCAAYYLNVQNNWYYSGHTAGYSGGNTIVWIVNPITRAVTWTTAGASLPVWPVRPGI